MNALRIRHLENCLNNYERLCSFSLSLDRYLHKYFAAHPKIKVGDKHFISDQAQELFRWRHLIDALAPSPVFWASRIKMFYRSLRWKTNTMNPNLPFHIRCSFPIELYSRLVASLGEKQAFQTGLVLNEPPPRYLRVNVNNISRDDLYRYFLDKGVSVEKCTRSPIGLRLVSSHRLLDFPEYRQGYFELQDEGSQLVASRVACQPGETVLDYCTGYGGKATVYGVFLQNRGTLILHDIEEKRLRVAKMRLKLAGITRIILAPPNSEQLQKYKGRCDWVVCDVPSTSTGSLKRNPELKLHYSDAWLEELVQLQREIVKNAATYLKSESGRLVYSTGSLLNEENKQQIQYIEREIQLELVGSPDFSLPLSQGHSGFFCAIFRKKAKESNNICHETANNKNRSETSVTIKHKKKQIYNQYNTNEIEKSSFKLKDHLILQNQMDKNKTSLIKQSSHINQELQPDEPKENQLLLSNNEAVNQLVKDNSVGIDDIDIEFLEE